MKTNLPDVDMCLMLLTLGLNVNMHCIICYNIFNIDIELKHHVSSTIQLPFKLIKANKPFPQDIVDTLLRQRLDFVLRFHYFTPAESECAMCDFYVTAYSHLEQGC